MNNAPRPHVYVGALHYQILAGAGLALVLFAQLAQGIVPGNLLVVLVGLLGIVLRWRGAALLVLFAFTAEQLIHHRQTFGSFQFEDHRPFLHVRDLTLAIGLVLYVASIYRLQSLWRSILPIDRRRRQLAASEKSRQRRFETVAPKRSERLLTPQEIAAFVIAVPLWALAGQALWLAVARRWSLEVFPMRLERLILLLWLLIVGLLVVTTIFIHWRRRQMDRDAAHVYLQDTLWRETRREQRRTFRWLAWRRLHERAEEKQSL